MKLSMSTIIAAGAIIISASTANAGDYWQGQGYDTGYGAVEVMPNGNLGSGNAQLTPDGYVTSDTGVGVLRTQAPVGYYNSYGSGINVNTPYSNVQMGNGFGSINDSAKFGAGMGALGAVGGVIGAVQGVSGASNGLNAAGMGAHSAKDALAGAGLRIAR